MDRMIKTLSFPFLLRVTLVALLSTLWGYTSARAHELQPAVMDIEIFPTELQIFVEWNIEAPLAGLDLDGLENTNDADNEDDYLALRALTPEALEQTFRDAWPDLHTKITMTAGDTALAPEITSISIPKIGNTELSRTSTIALTAALPSNDAPLVIGWTADLGPLIVRQRTVEGGYAGFLTSGALSDPIPRSGATETSALAAFIDYIAVGFDHIVPKGLDHILFVLGLFFFSLKMRPLLWQVTAFTLAHTVTLALGTLDIIRIPASIVEPLIAASIVYVAVENILTRELRPWRPVVVFCFGLLHGLGFASVLQDFGLSSDNFVAKLIGFNVGVELGQLSVIAAAYLLVGHWFGEKPWYRAAIAIPASLAIAAVGGWWTIERVFL